MKPTAPSKNLFNYASSVLLFALAFVLYYPTHGFDFAYDDVVQIERNQLVSEEAGLFESVKMALLSPTPPGNLYRPTTTLSYRLNRQSNNLDPHSYHFTNTLLYGVVCVLVFWAFLLLGPAPALHSIEAPMAMTSTLSLLSALLFTLHPVHVEAVANVVGRAELLACAFGLTSLFILRWSLTRPSNFGFFTALVLGITCFGLSVLSKESALTFALIIPLVQLRNRSSVPLSRFKVRFALGVIALILCSAGLLLIRYAVLADSFFVMMTTPFENPENALAYFSPIERALHSFRILGDYLLLLVIPSSLSADYSLTPAQVFADTYSIAGLLSLLVVAAYLLVLTFFRKHYVFFSGAWFFITFALTANLITPIGTIMGERLLFTPSIGAIYFFVYLLFKLTERFRCGFYVSSSITLVFAICLAFVTIQRIPVWQNNQTLFSQTLLDAPQSPKATYNYAVHLRTSGAPLDECQKYFMKTLELLPNHTLSMVALADIALERKSYARVEFWYKRILEIEPSNEVVKVNLEKLNKFKQEL